MKRETYELECVRGLDMMGEQYQSERTKMFRFLSIFHPELSLAKRLKLSNQLYKKGCK